LGSCRGKRLLARPDDANQKSQADGSENGEGYKKGLKEGKPGHSQREVVGAVKTTKNGRSNDNKFGNLRIRGKYKPNE
jgi:hypothetical protein